MLEDGPLRVAIVDKSQKGISRPPSHNVPISGNNPLTYGHHSLLSQWTLSTIEEGTEPGHPISTDTADFIATRRQSIKCKWSSDSQDNDNDDDDNNDDDENENGEREANGDCYMEEEDDGISRHSHNAFEQLSDVEENDDWLPTLDKHELASPMAIGRRSMSSTGQHKG